MNKFLFKSTNADLSKNVINKLDMILAENRHQRSDLALIIHVVNKLLSSANLQKQVDEYFEEDKEDIPEVTKLPVGNREDCN